MHSANGQCNKIRRTAALVGNSEITRGGSENLGVGLVRSTLAHTEGTSDGVKAGKPLRARLGVVRVGFGGRGVDRKLDRVGSGSQFREHASGSRRIVRASVARDLEIELSSSGVVRDFDVEDSLEGGLLGTLGGAHDKIRDTSSAVVVDGAKLDKLAEVERIEIRFFDQFNEGLNANISADNVASVAFDSLFEIRAEFSTFSNDTGVENVVEKDVERLSVKLSTGAAQRATFLLDGNLERGRLRVTRSQTQAAKCKNKGSSNFHDFAFL